jgi:tRNA-splicing ligase RtcB
MDTLSKRLISWASLLDEKTLEQAHTTARMPFIYPHLALMPDAHLGKGATVGSVIPTLGAIIPAAVGVDIGCGMIAVRTSSPGPSSRPATSRGCGRRSSGRCRPRPVPTTRRSSPPRLRGSRSSRSWPRRPRASTRASTPGTGATSSAPWGLATTSSRSPSTRRTGCGCSCTPAPAVWATRSPCTTSGSASRLAQAVVDRAAGPGSRLPRRGHTGIHRATSRQLKWAQHFALLNREEMMDRVARQVSRRPWASPWWRSRSGSTATTTSPRPRPTSTSGSGCPGRVPSRPTSGRLGLIPGSMGTASYVVRGPGVQPGGAELLTTRRRTRVLPDGRRGGPSPRDQLREAMVGIEYRDTDAFIDEIPQAYKPIDQVMEDAGETRRGPPHAASARQRQGRLIRRGALITLADTAPHRCSNVECPCGDVRGAGSSAGSSSRQRWSAETTLRAQVSRRSGVVSAGLTPRRGGISPLRSRRRGRRRPRLSYRTRT